MAEVFTAKPSVLKENLVIKGGYVFNTEPEGTMQLQRVENIKVGDNYQPLYVIRNSPLIEKKRSPNGNKKSGKPYAN